mgnify:CR=1 FL=1
MSGSPLTPDQMAQLEKLAKQANEDPSNASARKAYYEQLAQYEAEHGQSDYGELAEGVPDGSTLEGYIARQFALTIAESEYNLTPSQAAAALDRISLQLMNADLSARQNAGGADIDGGIIKTYHESIFADPSNKMGVDAWTAERAIKIFGPDTLDGMIANPQTGVGSHVGVGLGSLLEAFRIGGDMALADARAHAGFGNYTSAQMAQMDGWLENTAASALSYGFGGLVNLGGGSRWLRPSAFLLVLC